MWTTDSTRERDIEGKYAFPTSRYILFRDRFWHFAPFFGEVVFRGEGFAAALPAFNERPFYYTGPLCR